MSTADRIRELFSNIETWRLGDQRAPHKPLLLLYALARVQNASEPRLARYEGYEPELEAFLRTFGNPSAVRTPRPYYPFWRLQNDDLWEIPQKEDIRVTASGDPHVEDLRGKGEGGFPDWVFQELRTNPGLVIELAMHLLERAFPDSLHEMILNAVGLTFTSTRRSRSSSFRREVIRNFGGVCAVCGYDGRLGASEMGLEAAHIMWHAAGGPDDPENGLALCSLHHLVFDRGGLGLSPNLKILVSADVRGGEQVERVVRALSGRALRPPLPGMPTPNRRYVEWHQREVFRSPALG